MKKIILAFCLITILSVVQSFAPKQDRRFNLSLTGQEIDIILQGLNELPKKTSESVYNNIIQQAQAQLAPPKPLPKPDSTSKNKKP